MKATTVDKVCAKPLLGHPSIVLIEGDELSFEFLGRLFLAQAKAINGCGFSIEPRGPGSAFFSKKSTMGVYLHRLPCDEPKRKRS
jgi:hypothetical protein